MCEGKTCYCDASCPKRKKVPHIHAELIKAWADGAHIQMKAIEDGRNVWRDWYKPDWTLPEGCYRIKPEPKPDVVRYLNLDSQNDSYCVLSTVPYGSFKNNIKVVFDGETGKMKSAELVS